MGLTGKTLGDLVKEKLAEAGVEEAHGVEVTFKDGSTAQIVSPDNPLLAKPAASVSKITIKQSAQAGAVAA